MKFFSIEHFIEYFIKIHNLFKNTNNQEKKGRPSKLKDIEIVFIMVFSKINGLKTMLDSYNFIKRINEDPSGWYYNSFNLPCYEQFTRIIRKNLNNIIKLLRIIIDNNIVKNFLNIDIIDSTSIPINKFYNSVRKWGKSYNVKIGYNAIHGFFQGFKLHIVINNNKNIIFFYISDANFHDVNILKNKEFLKSIKGILIGDKGYIANDLIKTLLNKNDINLITPFRKNMNKIINNYSKELLKERSSIESVFNVLKNHLSLINNHCRTIESFLFNIYNTLFSYMLIKN